MITTIVRNGPPEAMTCPAVICDHCGKPIHEQGNALWLSEYSEGSDRPRTTFAFTHKHCDHLFDRSGLWFSEELDRFLEQLVYNFSHQFRHEPNVEYIAPQPSTWRLGRYEREPSH